MRHESFPAKRIINAGASRVYFSDWYSYTEGVQLLQEAGIECVHVEPEEDELCPLCDPLTNGD